jgi:8-oxo-dGTP diphosphatase
MYTKRSPVPEQEANRLQVTVDVVIFTLLDGDLQIVLVRRRQPPQAGLWAIPGGAIEPDEALEDSALRILGQETGLEDLYLEQLYTFGSPGRRPDRRVIAVTYFAIVPADRAAAVGCRGCRNTPGSLAPPAPPGVAAPTGGDTMHDASGQEVSGQQRGLGWWSVYDLPRLAFDHGRIVHYALTRLRYKLEYTAVGFELLPQEFTLTELQTAYEIVLGEALDKRNFRRKILGAGIIEPSGNYRSGEGRPARLYRYREDAVAEVKARRLFP